MRLLAKGRAADVYDLGDGSVLRRYRVPWDTAREADIMRRLEAAGYPVPHVLSAEGDDLVMERIQGVTMLEDLARRPWRLVRHANLLATLMQRLHAIPADGGSILHGDFHPLNVLLTARGPVVIDWTASRIGPWPEDVAMTWLIVATSVPDDSGWQRALAMAGQRYFTRRFVKHFELEPVRAVLPDIGRLRLRDPHVTPREAARVRRVAGLVPEPEELE